MWTDVKGRHDRDAAQRVRADVRAANGRTIQRSVTYIGTDDIYIGRDNITNMHIHTFDVPKKSSSL